MKHPTKNLHRQFCLLAMALLSLFAATVSSAQITLPYFEGFENVGTDTLYSSTTTSLKGTNGWSYEKTSQGRLRFSANYKKSGSRGATLDASSTSYSTNYLIATLDMSNYTSNPPLELSFSYVQHGEERHGEDRVWVRGSNTSSWIEIYDWYAWRNSNGYWKDVENIRIDSFLLKNGQKPSSTFQLRIGQRDNFPARTISRDDGFTIDDISLKTPRQNDGQATELSRICSTTDLLLTIQNNAKLDLTSAKINWWLNGVKQKPAYYSGNISPENSAKVNLGLVSIPAGTNDLKFIVDSVNGKVDEELNDTLILQTKPGLKGKYTIGSTGSDFTSFTDAVADLDKYGMCGAVTFFVKNGTYTETISLYKIDGLSAANTLTIRGEDSAKTILKMPTADRILIDFNGVSHVSLANIRLETSSIGNQWLSHFRNGCKDISFDSCNFINVTSSTVRGDYGIVASASTSIPQGAGNNLSNLQVKNCRFLGGTTQISVYGSADIQLKGIFLENNIFNKPTSYCIQSTLMADIKIEQNELSKTVSSITRAVLLNTCFEISIRKNRVFDFSVGFSINNSNLIGKENIYFTNNIINTIYYGVDMTTSKNIYLQHNTISSRYGLSLQGCQQVRVQNNIIIGTTNYAFIFNSTLGPQELIDFDWNILQSSSSSAKYMLYDNGYSSLTALQTDNPLIFDNCSDDIPTFISSSDFHLDQTKIAKRAPFIGESEDIDGDLRCRINTAMGADESFFKQKKPSVKFNIPAQVYANSISEIVNDSPDENLATYIWSIDNSVVDSGAFNLSYRFTKKGRYKITLKARNCDATDTLSKFVTVTEISNAAIPAFNISKKFPRINEPIKLTNQSKNGMDSIQWKIEPALDSDGNPSFSFLNGDMYNTISPNIQFNASGTYTVCLYVSNSIGGSWLCKRDSIIIPDEINICDQDTSFNLFGVLRDPAGTSNYQSGFRYNCGFNISPCAKNLKLKFTEFDLSNGRDRLRIYEGEDNTGTALHAYDRNYSTGLTGSSTSSSFKDSLLSPSGRVYIEFTTGSFGIFPGFEIEWSAESRNLKKPTAKLNIEDSVCTGTLLFPENLSSGQENSYKWIISSPVTNTITYADSSISHYFFFRGRYEVQLIATNCGGSDTMTKIIEVVEADIKPTPKMAIDLKKPDLYQVVTLSDISSVDGYQCSEYRTWKISPSNYVFQTGYTAQSQVAKVAFTKQGCYDITLVAGNSQGLDSVIGKCAIQVISYCTPQVGTNSTDIGIRRVELATINLKSKAGVEDYSDYRDSQTTTLNLGSSYNLSIHREASPISDLNRKAWIDYNQDGDFTDAGEEVAASASGNKLEKETFKITIPLSAKEGSTTMRIGVSRANDSNTPCGTNNYGEFEDYKVSIIKDIIPPTVTLYGASTINLEKCSNWTDPGALVVDGYDTLTAVVTGGFSLRKIGTYTIRYTGTDLSKNSAFVERTIIVSADTTKPTFVKTGADTLDVEVLSTYTDPGVAFFDNCGVEKEETTGSVNTSIIGDYALTYKGIDSFGNEISTYRVIRVRDTQAPILVEMTGGDTIRMELNTTFTDPGILYSDNFDPTTSLILKITGTVNTAIEANYTLTYYVTDLSGNVDSFKRVVMVGSFDVPIVKIIGAKNATIDVHTAYTDPGVSYENADGTTTGLTLSISGSYIDDFGLNKTATEIGTYELIYTVENIKGKKTSITRYVEVLDRIAPTLSLVGNDTIKIEQFKAYIEPKWTISDNYWDSIHCWVYSFGEVDIAVLDTYQLSYYAADSSGNITNTIHRQVVVYRVNSLEEAQTSALSIYPNPSYGHYLLSTNFGKKEQIKSIRIFDALGRKLQDISLSQMDDGKTMIDLSDQAASHYYLIIQTDKGFYQEKLLLLK